MTAKKKPAPRSTVRTIKVEDVNVDPAVQIRNKLNPDLVESYAENWEMMPPIDVFETGRDQVLYLADGFHRMAAAKKLGKKTVSAVVHKGSTSAMLTWAIKANMRHGQALSRSERDAGIMRLANLNPEWNQARLSRELGISTATISYVFLSGKVRGVIGKEADGIAETTMRAIGTAPKHLWTQLAQATKKRQWGDPDVRAAVHAIADERIPKKKKDDILAGRSDPVVITDEGEVGIPMHLVRRRIAESKDDEVVALLRVQEALIKLRLHSVDDVVKNLAPEQLEYITGADFSVSTSHIEAIVKKATENKRLRVVS